MIKILRSFTLVGGIVLLFTACNEDAKNKPVTTAEITFKKDGELYFLNSERDTLKQLEIETAVSSYEQQTGLMYRKTMQEDRGMLFIYEEERPRPNFYMKNTHIALDLVYINKNNKVVDIQRDAKPFDETPIPSQAPAKYVLEINGGLAKHWNIREGDSVIFYLD
ncbi:DUF192 domain-containing protein [Mesonia sp. MT50]|uniref:DUF192 domain-containing protein n=1 Tax=Mesonia profundi TaxID=3070998 RepID=A0ABU0ZX53_9FLAO|nr:DUF192 domain-containing protein [Mesonia profundi]MDQ7916053.1 DUF192 domain-containing protein [Mesonia profundi]